MRTSRAIALALFCAVAFAAATRAEGPAQREEREGDKRHAQHRDHARPTAATIP